MKQQTLAMAADQGPGFEQHRWPTRREEFLTTMNEIVSWADLRAAIESYYPNDFVCEEALYDIPILRQFAKKI